MVAPSRIQHLIPSQSAKKKVAAAQHKCTARSDATGSTIFPKRGDPGASHHAGPGFCPNTRFQAIGEDGDAGDGDGDGDGDPRRRRETTDNQPTRRRAPCPDALQVDCTTERPEQ